MTTKASVERERSALGPEGTFNFELFRARLRQAMQEKSMSASELARKLEPPIHRATVTRWLNEERRQEPTLRQFFKTAALLDKSAAWLAGVSEDAFPRNVLSTRTRSKSKDPDAQETAPTAMG